VSLCALLTGAAFAAEQPEIGARVHPVLSVDGLTFRDSNGNGALDPYEDWRLPTAQRVADLMPRMSAQEKAGMMLIETLNAGCEGAIAGTKAAGFIQEQFMTRFILRNTVNSQAGACEGRPPRRGFDQTPAQIARFTNAVQQMAEGQAHGIPVLFKSNARNHYESDPRFGIASGAGSMTEFPKEGGIAAAALGTGDMSPVKALTEVMSAEWRAIGLRGMYGYMADLATEPRWYRVHETFTEDSALASDIMRTLVEGLQGGETSPETAVALTMKHWPGGGPQLRGLDAHYSFGKLQVYPGGAFDDHVAPFKAAVEAGVSSIMPYYGVPVDVPYRGGTFDKLGFAFSPQIIDGLLREELGFKGNVNSDTGIVDDRAWGLETATVPQRVAAAINAGTDVLSGFADHTVVTSLVAEGLLTEARVDQAVARLLTEQFDLGLFENPYVDAAAADAVIGSDAHREIGMDIQRKSVVLLQNRDATLPLAEGSRVYVLGMAPDELSARGASVTDGNVEAGAPRPSAQGHDAAIIRVQVHNHNTRGYRTQDAAYGANPAHINPVTNKLWGAEDPCNMAPEQNAVCVDDMNIGPMSLGLVFGGPLPWEVDNLSFTTMAQSTSWLIKPDLAEIQAVMAEIGAENTVLAIDFRSPYVLDEASGLRDAGALIATFGVSDQALVDVVSGQVAPMGKLPFALARTLEAVRTNDADLPGYAEADTLYPFGFGLTYDRAN
jgi:beta-glucosidase